MLEAQSLSKNYGHTLALDSLNLVVPPGEVFCLLGPNGAGKTTTINLFLDFVSPSAGQALVCGIDAHAQPLAARQRLAYIPETVTLYPALTGVENLAYFSALAGTPQRSGADTQALLLQAGLDAVRAQQPVQGYSKGMRQKVGIAIAMARRAQVLLLDEPTSGLDPSAANEFAAAVELMRGRGVAVLMVTHDLFLARRCAGRIGIMQRGRLVQVLAASAVDHLALERVYLDTTTDAARAETAEVGS